MDNLIPYKKIIFIACIISILLGVFLHFSYDIFNVKVLGIISPINESVWEHLKLIFIPFTLFSIGFYFYTKKKFSNMFLVTLFGNIVGMFVTVVLYYIGTLIFNSDNMIYNIIVYVIGISFSYYTLYLGIYNKQFLEETSDSLILGICTLVLMFTVFVVNTYYPIKMELTKDPITKTYGINEYT